MLKLCILALKLKYILKCEVFYSVLGDFNILIVLQQTVISK